MNKAIRLIIKAFALLQVVVTFSFAWMNELTMAPKDYCILQNGWAQYNCQIVYHFWLYFALVISVVGALIILWLVGERNEF